MNPLLEISFRVPFDQIKAEHVEPAIVDLLADAQRRLKEIDVELTELTTKFSDHVLDSTNAYELVLTEEHQLAGLPPAAVAAARASAEAKGKTGWRFTLQGPSYLALMTYLADGAIREQVWRAY